MVGSDTPDACESAFCSMPTRARAAFSWAAVSNVALQHKSQTSCLICSSCFKHQDYNLLPRSCHRCRQRPSTRRGFDEREQLGSKNHTPLQKFAVPLLTNDISTIDHAW